MKILNFILCLICIQKVSANIESYEVQLLKKDSTCEEFVKNVSKCIPSVCGVSLKVGKANVRQVFKISGKIKENKCNIFYSFKTADTVDVTLFEFSQEQLVDVETFVKEGLKGSTYKITSEQKCCNKDPKVVKFCPMQINGKTVNKVFDSWPYQDCKTGLLIFPLKRKIIKY